MTEYELQFRIKTLLHNMIMKDAKDPSFSQEDIHFSQWDFSFSEGWRHDDYWLARGTIEGNNHQESFSQFWGKLTRIIPRVSFIGHCYIDYLFQPYLILKAGTYLAFLRYTKEIEGVGLGFTDDGQKALGLLLQNSQIPEAFYYYWNDAVNTTGYSSKLLLMCSAIEALVGNDRRTKYQKREELLGTDLNETLYGTKVDPQSGLRHRLAHGEYFKPQ